MLSPKNTRKLSKMAGIEFDRALIHSHGKHWIAECRTAGDLHYLVDRRTGSWELIPRRETGHWTSCRELHNES
jgi:hypothetical protein